MKTCGQSELILVKNWTNYHCKWMRKNVKPISVGYMLGLSLSALLLHMYHQHGMLPPHVLHDFEHFKFFKSDVERRELQHSSPLFCVISTSATSTDQADYKLDLTLSALQFTWTQRCNQAHFMPTPKNSEEGYNFFALSDLVSFRYAQKNIKNNGTLWFLKTTDNVYVVVDRLEQYLRKFDPDKLYAFFLVEISNTPNDTSHLSTSRSLVLSRGALQKLVNSQSGTEFSHGSRGSCLQGLHTVAECFRKLGITTTQAVMTRHADPQFPCGTLTCSALLKSIQSADQPIHSKNSSVDILDHIFLHPFTPGEMFLTDYLLYDHRMCPSTSNICERS